MPIGKKATNHKHQQEVKFDEAAHKYFLDEQELKSVTTWMDEYFFVPFKKDNRHVFIANAVTKKNKREGSGITNGEALRKFWHLNGLRTSSNGTAAHSFIEMIHIAKGYNEVLVPDTGYEEAGLAAYEALTKEWDIVELEKRVFSKIYKLGGHIDAIIKHKKTGALGVLDWKTMKDTEKAKYETNNELKRVHKGKVNALYRTAIQLEIYARLLDKNISTKYRFVVQLKSDATYKIYKGDALPDVQELVQVGLETRRDIEEDIMNSI